MEIIDKTNEMLGFTPGVLLEKLQKIQTILLDEEFVRGCLKLEEVEKKKKLKMKLFTRTTRRCFQETVCIIERIH